MEFKIDETYYDNWAEEPETEPAGDAVSILGEAIRLISQVHPSERKVILATLQTWFQRAGENQK